MVKVARVYIRNHLDNKHWNDHDMLTTRSKENEGRKKRAMQKHTLNKNKKIIASSIIKVFISGGGVPVYIQPRC